MKVVTPSKELGPKKSAPLLPITEDPEEYALTKTNSVTWELYTIPTDGTSPRYKYQVRILEGNETARQLIRWRMDLQQVITGLNLTTVATIMPIHTACMRSHPKSLYEGAFLGEKTRAYEAALTAARATDATAGDTVASQAVITRGVDAYAEVVHLNTALGFVVADLLPQKVLSRVKRSLRRETRKPIDMKVRKYFQSLCRINNEELPNLPPFGTDQSLSEDEMIDILLHGTPRSWQTEMERQGFDPMGTHVTAATVVDFMENIESVEASTFKDVKDNKSSKDKKKTSSSSSASTGKKKAKYYCKHHGPNSSHDTKDCLVLNGGDKDGQKSSSNKKPYGNKSWKRKAEEANATDKKDLAAFVKEQVKKGVKKQLASVSKKRKSDSDSESDGEKDCYLVETLTKDLDGFNYEEMEKLSINDEVSDEVSV